MTEYGLFNDEGCVERGFWSAEEADAANVERYEPDDELTAHPLCAKHEEQPADGCEECDSEDED